MAQCVRGHAAKTVEVSLRPGTHTVRGKNRLPKIVL